MADPQVNKFLNEQVRPLAERIRAINIKIQEIQDDWKLVSGLIKAGDDAIDDGRDAEGVSRLTGNDVNTFIALVADMSAVLTKIGSQDAIQKPCVQPLEIR